MQNEELNSNSESTVLFENEYCLITSEGILRQKNNSFFDGKDLQSEITNSFEEQINPYIDAFKEIESSLKSEYGDKKSISENEWDTILNQAKLADAIGNFEDLLQEFKSKIAKEPNTEAKQETPEAEPKEDAFPADVVADDQADTKTDTDASADADSDDTEKTTDSEIESKPELTADHENKKSEDKEGKADVEAEDHDPVKYYEDLKDKAEKAATSTNFNNGLKTIDAILASWGEGPEADASLKDSLRHKVEKAKDNLLNRKAEYEKKQEDRREKNFKKREEILAKFQQIVEKKKWQLQNQINSFQRKFDSLKPLPKEGIEDQNKKFQELLSVFDENRVKYLVDVGLKEEDNFTGKLIITEKLERLIAREVDDSTDWEALGNEFNELLKQWRKIGRVPIEKEADLKARFDKATDSFIEKRLESDKKYKKHIDKLKKRHEKLISRAKALSETDDLIFASREINRLHSDWRALENLPQKLNDEYWADFKEASDAFNKIKSENADLIKEQEEKNIAVKQDLIKKAQEVAEKLDFKSGNKQLDNLLAQWKKSGPVTGKKSRQLWRKFRKAMDVYYNQRRKHFEGLRKEQEENLKKKEEIVAAIKEAATAENPEEVLKDVQKLQDDYKQIGFVPIKKKDKIWKAYRAACDNFFDALRDKGSGNVKGSRFENRLDKEVTSEIFRLRKEADRIREQVMKLKDNMTYFKPNKKGLELRSEIQENIDKAEAELESKVSRINELQKKLEEIHE